MQTAELRFPDLNPAYFDSVYQFHATSAVVPRFSRDQVERFLTTLISSPENAVEIWKGEEKIACAVLLDQIHNIHHSAHIEVLGISKVEAWTERKLQILVDHFTEIVRKRGEKKGLIMTYHSSQPWDTDAVARLGFEPFYKTYEMESDLRFVPNVDLPKNHIGLTLEPTHFDEYYDVFTRAFARNPETSMGSKDESRQRFIKRPIATFGIQNNGKLVGFYNIGINTDNGEGEVQSIGVLPESRGQGIGRYLLSHACNSLKARGVRKALLGVAVTNASALGLYMDAGFMVTEEFSELRKQIT